MSRILRCDWLNKRARWRYLARSGLPAVSRKEIVFFFHVINLILTKLVQSRWLDIGLVLLFRVQKRAKQKERGQYPVFLTSRLVNNPDISPPWRDKQG